MVGDVGGEGFWGVTDLTTDANVGGADTAQAEFLEGGLSDVEAGRSGGLVNEEGLGQGGSGLGCGG